MEELIREEVSKVVLNELSDPRIGFVTVTGVRLSDDFHTAEVSVSILEPEGKRSAAMMALEASAGLVQRKIMPYINTRRSPRIRFLPDDTVEKSARISSLIREARTSDTHPEDAVSDGGDEEDAGDE